MEVTFALRAPPGTFLARVSRFDLTRSPEVNIGETAVLFSTTTGTNTPGAEIKVELVSWSTQCFKIRHA